MKAMLGLLLLITLVSCKSASQQNQQPQMYNSAQSMTKPYVILISIDGYRHDYTKMYQPKNIMDLASKGTYTKGLIPIYPTKTFPNHYSIVTGLKAENHGIVSNAFWDRERGARYKLGDSTTTTDGSWYKGEPLWISTQNQGMLSASYFWVGSDANIQDRHPNYWFPYNGRVPNNERVDQVIDWLKMDEKVRPHFITLYFSDVDSAGHKYSPQSNEVKEAIHYVDQSIGRLMDGLKEVNLPVNVIIVSDHGMQALKPDGQLYLEDMISMEGVRVVGKGSHANLYIEDKKRRKEVYKKLSKQAHMKVYKRGKTPRSFGYRKGPRIGDVTISVAPKYYLRITRPEVEMKASGGTHGYETEQSPEMMGIFYASGPNVKTLGEIPAFRNIHIYPFIMKMLGLKVKVKIDGKSRVLKKLLK